jgi:hypothetical protein
MSDRKQFVISLLVIIFFSWADIKFFGFLQTYNLSPLVRQSAHNSVLVITCLTGYLYFRKKEHWLSALWLAFYVIEFLLIIVVSLIFTLKSDLLSANWKVIVAETRLLAEGPVPFLVFYLLHRLTQGFSGKTEAE